MENVFQILPLVQVNTNAQEIDIGAIRDLCARGLRFSCFPEDRALAWLCMLSIYPANPRHWEATCATFSRSYSNFRKQFALEDDSLLSSFIFDDCFQRAQQLSAFSGGSSNANQNRFGQKGIDAKLMLSIVADIKRSANQFPYFSDLNFPTTAVGGSSTNGITEITEDERVSLSQEHLKRLVRILYIFAKVNQEFGYIQGFNELIFPMYYVMMKAKILFLNNADIVEAVTYEAFQFLLISSDLGDFFTTLTQSNGGNSGCESRLSKFDARMKRFLPKMTKKLGTMKITSMQFAFKWFNIMFAQEHRLPDLLPLWDALLAHLKDLEKFMFCVGIARLKTIEKKVEAEKNLGAILTALCSIQVGDITWLIESANSLFHKSQVSLSSCNSSSINSSSLNSSSLNSSSLHMSMSSMSSSMSSPSSSLSSSSFSGSSFSSSSMMVGVNTMKDDGFSLDGNGCISATMQMPPSANALSTTPIAAAGGIAKQQGPKSRRVSMSTHVKNWFASKKLT